MFIFITFDLFGSYYRLTVGLMVITTIVDGVYKSTNITGGYHLLWWNFEKLVMPIRATRGCWNHGTCAVVYNYMWVFADISFTVPQHIIDCHSTWSYLRRYVRVSGMLTFMYKFIHHRSSTFTSWSYLRRYVRVTCGRGAVGVGC